MTKRILEKDMEKYLDAKLATNGLAQTAIKNKDARTVFRLAAEACVGIKETSPNNGPLVSLIQDTVGGPDHVAWCMSFVQTCLAYAEKKTKVISPIYASETCTEVWDKTPKAQRVKIAPLPGAITIWKRGSSWQGHTGLMLEYYGKTFLGVEGNTGGASMRDGDGIYIKTRSSTATGSLKILGWLKPF